MKIQFSIIVIFAALAAVVYGVPAHNDHIGRALMRRGCNWSHCSTTILPSIVSCLKAGLKETADGFDDAACFAALGNDIDNIPTDCQGCVDAVTKEGAVILKDVENGIEDIPTIADHVWNEIKGWFDKVKDWFKHHF